MHLEYKDFPTQLPRVQTAPGQLDTLTAPWAPPPPVFTPSQPPRQEVVELASPQVGSSDLPGELLGITSGFTVEEEDELVETDTAYGVQDEPRCLSTLLEDLETPADEDEETDHEMEAQNTHVEDAEQDESSYTDDYELPLDTRPQPAHLADAPATDGETYRMSQRSEEELEDGSGHPEVKHVDGAPREDIVSTESHVEQQESDIVMGVYPDDSTLEPNVHSRALLEVKDGRDDIIYAQKFDMHAESVPLRYK